MPISCRPAATRSTRSRNWPKVTVSPSAAMSMGWSGDAWARRSTSSHMVRAPVSISLVVMTPPSGTTLIAAGGGGSGGPGARRGRRRGRMAAWRDARCIRRPVRWRRMAAARSRSTAGARSGWSPSWRWSSAGVVRGGQHPEGADRLLGLPPPGAADPRHRDFGPARGADRAPDHAAQAQAGGVAARPQDAGPAVRRGGLGRLGRAWGIHCKSMTAFPCLRSGSKLRGGGYGRAGRR